jgi:hypothetical protein
VARRPGVVRGGAAQPGSRRRPLKRRRRYLFPVRRGGSGPTGPSASGATFIRFVP